MTTPLKNLQPVRGFSIEDGEKHETPRNDTIVNDQEFNINMNLLHKEYHKSHDSNHQNHLESNDQSYFSMERQASFEVNS